MSRKTYRKSLIDAFRELIKIMKTVFTNAIKTKNTGNSTTNLCWCVAIVTAPATIGNKAFQESTQQNRVDFFVSVNN
jgi:hypothetical protein